MTDLKSQLEQLKSEIENSSAWSFSSDAWDQDWSGADFYSSERIRKQYMGLIEETNFATMSG